MCLSHNDNWSLGSLTMGSKCTLVSEMDSGETKQNRASAVCDMKGVQELMSTMLSLCCVYSLKYCARLLKIHKYFMFIQCVQINFKNNKNQFA